MDQPTPSTQPPADNPTRELTRPIQFVKGVGPHRAELLEKLGLRTAADLLFFFPRNYQDFTQLDQVTQLSAQQDANLVGTVCDIDQNISHNGKHILYVLVQQEKQFVRAVWFNQPFMLNKFAIGQRVLLQGRAKLSGGRFQLNHPKVTWLESDLDLEQEIRLAPVYGLTEGINQRQMRTIVRSAVEDYVDLVPEAMPDVLRSELDVCGIHEAIRLIHDPRSHEQVQLARKRLVYQELFVLQLALAIRRYRVRRNSIAPVLEMTPKIRSRILRRLPFELTETQQQALQEIGNDLAQPFPMNRLVHGEVGSGKTAVALCAMLVAVAHGFQAVMMAPTEVLARQHARTLNELLATSRVKIGLWTGSLKTAQRRELSQQIASGEINIVVGTQAIVASQLTFDQLGLVVIDEQHKFGVKQRANLKQSHHDPHYLVMTATPIPRTISMTLFGDLDVSVLARTSGVGQRVHTYLGQQDSREQWWDFVRKKLNQGRQAFVISPLVDANDESDVSGAEQLYESLSNGPFADYRLDVLHGRQSADDKESAMRRFEAGETQLIVATGVVEVGINVPNATVMTIESAERFGLSQLHQLRGRVSRGKHPGYVCAFATSNNPMDNERLTAFAETESGFELAETDLRLRGPGNLFSTEQSGFPPLMIADLIRDAEVLEQAQQQARRLIEQDAELAGPEFDRLRQLVFARYGAALDISDVG